MSLDARESAARVAQQMAERCEQLETGLKESGGTTELVGLAAANTADARDLAQWFQRQPIPLVKPRICLVIDRADGHSSEHQVGGGRVTPTMVEAAEDLRHTLMTGTRRFTGSWPQDFYVTLARAFGTTLDEAKTRVLGAMYGTKHVAPGLRDPR